jgi:L-alanine-DL-glutamate epimerase-like enolase superfamily enzyme
MWDRKIDRHRFLLRLLYDSDYGCLSPTIDDRNGEFNFCGFLGILLSKNDYTNMMKITSIQITYHQLELEPPFPAAWDSEPRARFPVTIVRVSDNEGRVGIGSGDPMYGFSDYAHLFIDQNPLDLVRHNQVLSNISFHAGRPWPLEVALWDLAGKILEKPVYQMLGGHHNRVRGYASSGMHRPPQEMARLARTVLELGFPALKIRFGRSTLEQDFKVLAAVAKETGDELTLMVDCNQGWHMPWDTARPWDYHKALEVAQELERYPVYWMEEPLHRGDYTGMNRLRGATKVLLAGGEMTREIYEFQTLLERECLDIYQPDAVCTGGIAALSRLAFEIADHNKVFTPHTWGNGIGLLANLHLTAGTTGAPFIEFPLDPPDWTAARRDFMLMTPIEPDTEGWLVLSNEPGLGIKLNEGRLAATFSNRTSYS